MTVTERLMKPGQWSVKFKPDAAYWARAAADYHDHIVITVNRLRGHPGLTDSVMLPASIYTGVVLERFPRELRGAGLAWHLADDQGLGDVLDTSVSQTAATLSTWITALRPSSLSAGTVTNTGTTLTAALQYITRREAIDFVCRSVGAEWKISPAGALSAAAPGTLFTSYTTPTAIITARTRTENGAGLVGINATQLDPAGDVLGFTTKVIVVGQTGDGAAVATGSATGSTSYKDLFGNALVRERLVNSPSTPSASATTLATNLLALFSAVRTSTRLTSDVYAATTKVAVGDRVYVFDPESGLSDTANKIVWRGELIHPIILRVKAITWGIQPGMGVYIRSKTGTYTDISDQVEFKRPDAGAWEVGATVDDPTQDPKQLGTAFLGVNGDIVDRLSASRITYTPTWSGTIGNGTITGSYQLINGWCHGHIEITWGTTTSHAAATQTFSLPSGVTTTATAGSWCGGARIIDLAPGTNYIRHAVTASTTSVALTTEAGAFVTQAVPMTWATGDVAYLTFSLPV